MPVIEEGPSKGGRNKPDNSVRPQPLAQGVNMSKRLNRFLVFGWNDHDIFGGMEDLLKDVSSLPEVLMVINDYLKRYDVIDVYDQEKEFVIYKDDPKKVFEQVKAYLD